MTAFQNIKEDKLRYPELYKKFLGTPRGILESPGGFRIYRGGKR
jgi:hypothetical protein